MKYNEKRVEVEVIAILREEYDFEWYTQNKEAFCKYIYGLVCLDFRVDCESGDISLDSVSEVITTYMDTKSTENQSI